MGACQTILPFRWWLCHNGGYNCYIRAGVAIVLWYASEALASFINKKALAPKILFYYTIKLLHNISNWMNVICVGWLQTVYGRGFLSRLSLSELILDTDGTLFDPEILEFQPSSHQDYCYFIHTCSNNLLYIPW